METSVVATPPVSDEKHFAVNVNLKPLFGGNGNRRRKKWRINEVLILTTPRPLDEPFKLFGNDDTEAEIEHDNENSFAASFAPSQHKEVL